MVTKYRTYLTLNFAEINYVTVLYFTVPIEMNGHLYLYTDRISIFVVINTSTSSDMKIRV